METVWISIVASFTIAGPAAQFRRATAVQQRERSMKLSRRRGGL
jgi:hypothetical protein